MGIFQNNLLAASAAAASAGGGGFYSYQIEQSCRFDGAASNSYINKTNGTATNTKIGTYSYWVKRSLLSTTQQTLFAYDGGGINSNFRDTNKFRFSVNNDTASAENQESDGVIRDINGWYHFVLAVDTTQGTNANRTKVYVNGVEDTSSGFDGTVSQNSNFSYNNSSIALYFGHNTGATIQPDLYLAEFIGVDGQQLSPTSFGEFKNGVWIPIDYAGSYGNNGFRLKFENASDLGNDSSGNNNDFSTNGLGPDHQVLDSPTFGS